MQEAKHARLAGKHNLKLANSDPSPWFGAARQHGSVEHMYSLVNTAVEVSHLFQTRSIA